MAAALCNVVNECVGAQKDFGVQQKGCSVWYIEVSSVYTGGMPAFCTWTDFALHARQSLLYTTIYVAQSPRTAYERSPWKSPPLLADLFFVLNFFSTKEIVN